MAKKKCYLITDPFFYDETGVFPILWTDLPDDILNKIPPHFLKNVPSLKQDGSIGEKTVIYVRPTEHKFRDDETKFDFNGFEIGIDCDFL